MSSDTPKNLVCSLKVDREVTVGDFVFVLRKITTKQASNIFRKI